MEHFPRYWPYVRGINRSPVNSPHKACDAELWCFIWYAKKRLCKQSRGRWFQTPLWRNCNKCLFPEQNYALNRPTYSSSQTDNGDPSLAVDGNPDPDRLQGRSCSNTAQEQYPRWGVDLQRPRRVTAVEISNRLIFGKHENHKVISLLLV